MDGLQLFYGPLRPVFFSSLILIMLLLMFMMSLRLYLSRRKKSYVTFTVALIMLMLQYAFIITTEISGSAAQDWAIYGVRLLKTLSFIYVNWGVYRLYNSSAAKQQLVFTLLTVVGVVLSLIHFAAADGFGGTPGQLRLLQDFWLELYLFLVLFYFYARITPRIGQTTKYQLGLALFFAAHSVHVVHEYGLDGQVPLLSLIEDALTVSYFIMLFLLLFERVVELLQAIYTSSITDALTGLYNRRYFMNHVQHYVHHNVPVSVIFSDIDNFKKLNDTLGHQRGDDALRQVAHIVKDACAEIGVCGRYGGEEMVVLVTDTDTDVGELAETIRRRVEAEAGVTVSIGYSKLKRGVTPDALVKQADEAMYKAKTTGKNKVAKYVKQAPMQIG
ncbi:GGDEF domain-containing protein [Paenibacillus sp. MBLB4367]|uniref:GGDEF domain-containing protein n=1 Tax=Paenibacillus sp. MBLB4367 TaxID=3384767 RepID=UPI0039081575